QLRKHGRQIISPECLIGIVLPLSLFATNKCADVVVLKLVLIGNSKVQKGTGGAVGGLGKFRRSDSAASQRDVYIIGFIVVIYCPRGSPPLVKNILVGKHEEPIHSQALNKGQFGIKSKVGNHPLALGIVVSRRLSCHDRRI